MDDPPPPYQPLEVGQNFDIETETDDSISGRSQYSDTDSEDNYVGYNYPPTNKAQVIRSLFHSIRQTSHDAVALIFQTYPRFAGPNSHNLNGKTVLAAAVETGNIRMVEMLLNMGADVDLWSVQGEYMLHRSYYRRFLGKLGGRKPKRREVDSEGYPPYCRPEYHILRTPLMIAASNGYLPIVKLLFNPPCNADHTLCAPDGQTALRLAVDNGHRGVVNFLPSLRKGGLRRFKHQHATSMYRIRQLTEIARWVLLGLVWRLPKALIYKIPKWAAKELWRMGKYFFTNSIPRTGRYLINEFPKDTVEAAKSTLKGVIPAVRVIVETIWEIITAIPQATRATGGFIWKTITVSIPQIIKFIAKSILQGAKIVAIWIRKFAIGSQKLLVKGILLIISLIHTIFEATVTFFRSITLKDIWNGFIQVLRWLFVEVPMALRRSFTVVYVGICKAIIHLFGSFGKVMVVIWHVLCVMVVYYPVNLMMAILEYSKVIVRGGKEILVWFNPKG